MRLVIVGYGNVGRELGILLAEKTAVLRDRYGFVPRIAGVATARHGSWIATTDEGIDPDAVVAVDWPNSGVLPDGAQAFAGRSGATGEVTQLIDQSNADVLIELSTLNPETGEPATSHIRAAMAKGMDVVTANKGPIALYYRDLRDAFAAAGRQLRFESTVMDGTPVINLAEFTLPASDIQGVRAIINATSNFILSGLVAGQTFEEALQRAQEIGIAEADPSLDLDGWDAAVKLTIVANVLMGADIRPQDVVRESSADHMREMTANLPPGSVVKQVATIARDANNPKGVFARVSLAILAPDDSLAGIGQGKAAIQFQTDTMGDLTVIEGPGTPRQTAFGVLADLVTIARGLKR